MSKPAKDEEQRLINIMYGTYADVLFVLFPFLVIAMQQAWVGSLDKALMRPDLSVAASILGGLAIGKFVLGLVTHRDLGEHRERIVFFIALTLMLVLGPSLILIISIVSSTQVPDFVAFVQPILLVVAITLYSSAVHISNVLTNSRSKEANRGPDDGDVDPEEATERDWSQNRSKLEVPERVSLEKFDV